MPVASPFVYTRIREAGASRRSLLAVLLDPDHLTPERLDGYLRHALDAQIDFFFVGGSLIMDDSTDKWIQNIKKNCDIPVVSFPGSPAQVSRHADALLLLSLVSGRNADLLIGQHVVAAPLLHGLPVEIISTAYLLIDGGVPTTVSYMSNTMPIPADKPQIAVCTAMAAEMLGMKMAYLDAGSGALRAVPVSTIEQVREYTHFPIIVGGGIRTPEIAQRQCRAGANLIVIGNVLEKKPALVREMSAAIREI